VREDFRHMQRYLDISIQQMSADFEAVRECLGIGRWLVFGGSWCLPPLPPFLARALACPGNGARIVNG
jgi:hypothetical protein